MNEKKRGGAVKKAPIGYYTQKEARERLGLTASTFSYYVRAGKIKKYVPPLKVEGFYSKKEIDQMATEIALYFHLHEETGTETRVARAADAQGIYDVLDSFGWQTAPVELRLAWYKVNPFIDYVVAHDGRVIGYITAVPYVPEALADMMGGHKRAWHIKSADIEPYRAGESYDLYIGIAVRQDLELHTRYAARLISGFLSFLQDLAAQGIMVRCLHAVSAEEPGQRFCRALGFAERPN